MAEGFLTIRICTCDQRRAAQITGAFIYDHVRKGWVFPNDPPRRMSAEAKYRALVERSEFPHKDHSGEPLLHHECSWCGLSLPNCIDAPSKSDGEYR